MGADGALITVGESGRDGGLVGIGNALTAIDGSPDASSRVGVEAIFEGKSPLGVAALPNPVRRSFRRTSRCG